MQIKIKKENKDGMIRLESSAKIKEIMINEDFLHPNKESISICFQGYSSSGIIDFSPKEIEDLYKSIKSRIHLIKGIKNLYSDKS